MGTTYHIVSKRSLGRRTPGLPGDPLRHVPAKAGKGTQKDCSYNGKGLHFDPKTPQYPKP